MSLNLARATAARSVASCLLGLFFLTGCSNAGQHTPARPQPRGHTAQALSTGYSGTATFDVPVVDPGTWQGTPIGTGSWSTTATPAQSGGPAGIGFYDNQSGQLGHFLMVGNFSGSGHFFGIVSDGAVLKLGASAINNSTLYAGIFDSATGDPVALASSGTITLTAAGLIGGRITGSFSGTLDDVTPTPGCTSSAQCQSFEQCVSGRCVPQGCTSNAQCGSGQVCQSGQCVTVGCTSNAQCGSGQQCQAGQCVTVTLPPCEGKQGSGNYSGKTGINMVCSAFANSGVNVTQAFATIADDGNGLGLFVMDPSKDSAGVILPLNACPSAPGPVAISSGSLWEQTSSGGATFYAARPATSASVNFTVVGTSIEGTFSMMLVGGGQVTGEFQVR